MKKNAREPSHEAVQQFKSRFDSKALILMYHRVADARSDPWALCVTPQHFAEQLEVLHAYMCPLRLQQLNEAVDKGNIPHRSVVVTFDDGYADNLYQARPLLERYDIPATVFIATGYLQQDREFWWNELERVLLEPGTLPDTLCLNINGETHSWELGEKIDYNKNDCLKYQGWRIWQETPTARHSLYRSLWQLLQPIAEGERLNVVCELRSWAGRRLENQLKNQPAHRALSSEEVIALAQGKLIEIGSHTVTHPVLSMLPVALQQEEIRQSKASLEEILNCPVTSFAYPYGARCNYTDETIAIIQQAGFTCACSTLEGVIEHGTDSFQLPRVQVQDWQAKEFARRLELWYNEKLF